MTLSLTEILLYAGGLFILFLTPGPVWVALVARAAAGGFHAAWPLALGVVVGDMVWPLLAIFGVALLVELYADFLTLLRWGGAAILIWMGYRTIRKADTPLVGDKRLSAGGAWAGFVAGLMVIMGNPKAILFYMGVLPGFFDLQAINAWDIAVIVVISAAVPFIGNLILGLFVGKARRFLSSPVAVRRTNLIAGSALVLVGLAIVVI